MVDYKDVVNALNNLTGDPVQAYRLFGERALKAWDLMAERRAKLYVFNPSGKIVWIVVGAEREYILYPVVGYCHCDDFFFAVMDGKALACQHLIARKLAEELSDYETVEAEDQLFDSLMDEWRRTCRE